MDLNSEQINEETIKDDTTLEETFINATTVDELKDLKEKILNGSEELDDTTEMTMRF